MKVLYKETVVQWITVDIPDLDESDKEDLESASRMTIWAEVQENGWDGEEVLENSFEEVND